MSSPFIGEIRMFAGNFAPAGWMFCEGQLLPISENDALFTLIGTTYGGDGQSTFALPDLRGRLPVHAGQGPGLSNRILAESSGAEEVTLTVNQIPAHSHPALGRDDTNVSVAPQNMAVGHPVKNIYRSAPTLNAAMAAQSITPVGGSQPHTNLMPFLCINFIISLFGIFPSQT